MVRFAVAFLLLLPAAAGLLTRAFDAGTGSTIQVFWMKPLEALGVSATSPLPVRQAWFAGIYLLAPLLGAATAAAEFGRPQHRTAAVAVAGSGLAIAGIAALASLLEP